MIRVERAGVHGSAAWSPDGKALATDGDGTVAIWDVTTGRSLRALSGHTGPSLDRRISTGPVRHFRGAGVRALAGHPQAAGLMAWSPDGATVATAGDVGTVLVWAL